MKGSIWLFRMCPFMTLKSIVLKQTEKKKTTKHTSQHYILFFFLTWKNNILWRTLTFRNIYITFFKSHPQPQNLMKGPVAVPPDLLLLFLSAAAWNPATSFSKPHSCHGGSATQSTVPSLHELPFERDYLRKNLSTQLF